MQDVSPAIQYITVILLSLLYVTSWHPTLRLFFPLFLLSLLSLKIHALSLKNLTQKKSYELSTAIIQSQPALSHATTRSLLHRSPSPSAGLHRLPSMLPSPYYKPQGRRLNSRCVKVRRLSAFPRCRKKNNKKARQTDVSKQIKMFFNEKSPISLIFIQL